MHCDVTFNALLHCAFLPLTQDGCMQILYTWLSSQTNIVLRYRGNTVLCTCKKVAKYCAKNVHTVVLEQITLNFSTGSFQQGLYEYLTKLNSSIVDSFYW